MTVLAEIVKIINIKKAVRLKVSIKHVEEIKKKTRKHVFNSFFKFFASDVEG